MLVAVTRPPAADLEGYETTWVESAGVDAGRAAAEHAAYRERLAALGLSVIALAPEPELPDAVFVEDTALVLPEVAILTRPGAPSRRAETPGIEAALAPFRPLERLAAPCTLDGGDVLRVDDVLWVALSTRTNHAGLKRLAHLVLPHGYRVKAIETRDCLHLKTACIHLGEDLVLANRAWVDVERLAGFEILDVHPDEPFGANALVLGGTVVYPASHPRTAERIAARGLGVELVDVSELQKMEAGVTCLSLVFHAEAAPG